MGYITNSTLQRKTPLKSKTSLKAKKDLRSSYAEKVKRGEKKVYKYKPKSVNRKKYFSIFTNDLHRCYITGTTEGVHVHHIFGGSRKKLSEKYGFLLPLRYDWHNQTPYSIHQDGALNQEYKRKCQEYYLEHYGTEEQFIREFGKSWIEQQKTA